MPKYMQANAGRLYLCGWKCVYCGRMNAEVGQVHTEAMVGYGFFGNDRDEASRMAGESARKLLAKQAKNTEAKINRRQCFHLLNVKGECDGCGRKQPWKERRWVRAALCAAYFFGFGKAVNVMHRPDFGLPLLLMAAGVLLIWYGGRYLEERLALLKLKAQGDETCVPLVFFEKEPEGIQADDPRMKAIRGLTWQTVAARMPEKK